MNQLNETDLRQFTGSLERYRHVLNSAVIYTPGVQYMAEKGGAYWLIDAIAVHLGSPEMSHTIQRDDRLRHLQFWKLTVKEDESALLTCVADSGCQPAVTQDIPWTDFPLPEVAIWVAYDGRHWTMMLPSEH